MEYDFTKLSAAERYKLLVGFVGPRPIALVTSRSTAGASNAAPMSFFNVFAQTPPLLILGLQALGTHLHQRLASEGKPGATMASGGAYDGWWNGGIRNTGNFHNIIAILTETIGSPTPMRIPLVVERQIPSRDLPFPIAPQAWRFRQSIDYSISFNRAVIDYAARNREHLLYDIYAMGRR